MGLAGCYVKVDRDTQRAVETLEQARLELQGRKLPVEVLISTMIQEIQVLPKSDGMTPVKGPLKVLEYVTCMQDWLVTQGYISLVFITTLLPCIRTW